MATQPTRKFEDKTICGINLFKDKGFGHARGPFRPNEAAARADKQATDRAAEAAATAQATQHAGEIAARPCPAKCKHKSSSEDPNLPQPAIYAADCYSSMPSVERVFDFVILGFRVKVDAWRWVSDASAEYDVQFVCE